MTDYVFVIHLASSAPIDPVTIESIGVALHARLSVPIVVDVDGRTTTVTIKDVEVTRA